MNFQTRTFVEFFVLSAGLLGAFALVGAPVKFFLRGAGVTVGRMVPAPAIGLSIVTLTCWYWGGPFGGARPMLRVLLATSALVVVIAVLILAMSASRREFARAEFRDPRLRQTLIIAAACFIGLAAIVTVTETQLFTRNNSTVIANGNNDAASYALLGQHMLDKGPDDPGNITGFDAGVRSEQFAFGSYAVLSGAAAFADLDVWQVMQPTMFAMLVLGAYALALLMREILGDERAVGATMSAVLAYAGLYMTYLLASWFFAQMIGIALVVSMLGTVFVAIRSSARRDRVGVIAVGAILIAGGLAVYPHMTLTGLVVLLPLTAVDCRSVAHQFRRGVTTLALFAASAGLAAMVAPGLLVNAIDESRMLADVEAGWSLPSIYPSELLGFQTNVLAGQGHGTPIASIGLFAAVIAIVVIAAKRGFIERALPLLIAMSSIYASYLLVFQREGGPTYRQWKWITFFAPVFVAAACACVVVLFSAIRPVEKWQSRGHYVLAGYAVIAMLFSTGAGFSLRTAPDQVVTLDEINLRFDRRIEQLPIIHVDATPYWETMWLAYFLRDTPVTLAQPSYYPPAAPTGEWALQRNDVPIGADVETQPLNDTYRIVRLR